MYLVRWEAVAPQFGLLPTLKKLTQIKNRTTGENLPHLVTLLTKRKLEESLFFLQSTFGSAFERGDINGY
jgi:hypothetical protein